MQERRKFPRLECPKDKSCTVTSTKAMDFKGELSNISRDGARLVSKNRFADAFDKVDISINYPELERTIPSMVQLVWHRAEKDRHTYGAKFLSIKNEDKFDLLEHFYEDWKNKILSKR